MNTTSFVFGGAALGLLASCWNYIKGFSWRIASLLIATAEFRDDVQEQATISYLIQHYKLPRFYDKSYTTCNETIKNRYGSVPCEIFGYQSIIFWNGWWPIIWRASSESEKNKKYASVTFIRGTLDIDAVAGSAIDEYNKRTWNTLDTNKNIARRYFVRHVPGIDVMNAVNNREYWVGEPRLKILKYNISDIGPLNNQHASELDRLVYPPEIMLVIKRIKMWKENRDWYEKKGIPWKAGMLLYGPPGTGKTSLVRAFAKDLDIPVYAYNLTELNNKEFIKEWHYMKLSAPCIALIEDIDNVFHGRTNITSGPNQLASLLNKSENDGDNTVLSPKLSFDTLLNCIDGVEQNNGVLTIITTNNVDKIDCSLGQPKKCMDGSTDLISTRPGRIDCVLELTHMTIECKMKLAEKLLGDLPESMEKIKKYLEGHGSEQETAAQFQERCSTLALEHFWLQNCNSN